MSEMGKKSTKKAPDPGANTYHRFYYLSFRGSAVSGDRPVFTACETVWDPGLAEVTVDIAASTVITRIVKECKCIVMFDQLTHQEESGPV